MVSLSPSMGINNRKTEACTADEHTHLLTVTMETITVAALGRPLHLGMLYDCRHDSLVPGLSLWDRDHLLKHVEERPHCYSDFDIVTSDSTEDKSHALNVEASLKASFLSGMVEVEGSGKYMKNNIASKNQARVTLKYEATTKFQELSMDHLGADNVKHTNVLQKGVATHVVTAVLYGAKAFFVFDREVSKDEDIKTISGQLEIAVKNLPSISIQGKGCINLEEKNITAVEKFSCKYHGDFLLETNPVTYQDAVQVYISLPKLLEAKKGNVLPLKVWLLPLTYFDVSATKLVQEISTHLVCEAQQFLEDITDLEVRCNDAMKTTTAQQFPDISKNLRIFKGICFCLKVNFQRILADKLPSIREGKEDEVELAKVLKKYQTFFEGANLNKWMDCQEREIDTLISITIKMENIQILSESNMHKEILSAEEVSCFVFNSGGKDSHLTAFLKCLQDKEELEDPPNSVVTDIKWFFSPNIFNDIRQKANNFTKRNAQDKKLAVALMGGTKSAKINRYKDGLLVTPPSSEEHV
ncbi:hypothetical protein Q5P01_007020 [Channa striata]|uniref:SNTX thioredoxin-like domain-containing protein n=1 Tax=Channa striata TaxID=64152 RepID=A0AA88T1A5_CHASR|nr:hypothetical protein Q5P01_007020 [Channa striata]